MESLSDWTLDEMVLLLHSKAQKSQGRASQYVRTVTYENVEEIPGRLRTKATGRADARTLTDPPGYPASEGHPIKPEDEDDQQKNPDSSEEEILSPGDGELPVGQGGVSVSPEEIQAAFTIEAVYSRVITRKNGTSTTSTTRARIWSLLRDRASSMEGPGDKQYKLLMQGPLVHVLVCLDCIKMVADRINRDSKKQLQEDNHRRLEELMERFDQAR